MKNLLQFVVLVCTTTLCVANYEHEHTATYWNDQAQARLQKQLLRKTNTGVAKNVILFLGDGMSIPTLTAARTHLGQRNGNAGEETELSFEKFPYVGLSKTYCVDKQVADSACSATAYLGGVKANKDTVGVTAAVKRGDCDAMNDVSNHVQSVAHYSQLKNKRTGIVTTTRVTHASPAGVYAHTAERDWESDTDVTLAGKNPKTCLDSTVQLVHGETGKNLNVIFGGGRAKFLPMFQTDEDGKMGNRLDNRNLINEWKQLKANTTHAYVFDRNSLLNIADGTEYSLGLFDDGHMSYNLERDSNKQPSLEEMTIKAIELLSNDNEGFFLFVEGGLIDKAHHDNKARLALDETIEFHKAIEAAVKVTNESDTLILVTADHAHTMTINGNEDRGHDVLGLGGLAVDLLQYTTLSYGTGPGYKPSKDDRRHDVSKDDLTSNDYGYPAIAPLLSATHGGDDVGIFASGPWSHLITSVVEQNLIAHVINFASCTGERTTACEN